MTGWRRLWWRPLSSWGASQMAAPLNVLCSVTKLDAHGMSEQRIAPQLSPELQEHGMPTRIVTCVPYRVNRFSCTVNHRQSWKGHIRATCKPPQGSAASCHLHEEDSRWLHASPMCILRRRALFMMLPPAVATDTRHFAANDGNLSKCTYAKTGPLSPSCCLSRIPQVRKPCL